MKVHNNLTNRTLNKIVTDINNNDYEVIKKGTFKTDEKKGSILRSPIPPYISKYLYLNNNTLSKCIRALSEDIVLGEVSCKDEKITNFWKNNQHDLYEVCLDYFTYGYAVAELLFNSEEKLVKIRQAPASSFSIYNIDDFVYARQDINGNHNYFQIHGEIYDKDYSPVDVAGTIVWLGGDELYNKFSIPSWYPCRNALISNILLEELDIKNLQEGNLMSGILAISGGKQIRKPNEPTFDELLKTQFSEVGNGLAVSYVENANRDQPLEMEYINLSNNNYQYLNDKYAKNEQSVFECWFMPKERLLNNEAKESMNSNKSSVLWDIYLRTLKNTQTIILFYCNDINKFYFKSNEPLSISLPTFEENTGTAIANVKELMSLGLMSSAEAVEYLNDNLDMQLTVPSDVYGTMKTPLNLL